MREGYLQAYIDFSYTTHDSTPSEIEPSKKLQEEYKLNKRKKGKFLQTEESLLQLSQNLQNAEVAHRDGDIDLSLKTYTDVAH